MIKKKKKSRYKSLDILRGLAIIMVLIAHLDPKFIPAIEKLSGIQGFAFWRLHTVGWAGVDLFFILSGFLISTILFKEMDRKGTIQCKRFWLRRGFKIWPSYLFLLLVLFLTRTTNFIDFSSPTSLLRDLGAHLFFMQNYLDHNPNGPTWSLAVEEHFYLLLPLLLIVLKKCADKYKKDWIDLIPYLTSFFVLLCLALRLWQATGPIAHNDYMESHFRMDALMIGVYCSYLFHKESKLIGYLNRNKAGAISIACILISPAFFLPCAHPFIFTIGFLLLSIAFSIILILFLTGLVKRWEDNVFFSVTAKIGTWSYNIYLWNYFLFKMKLPVFYQLNHLINENVTNVPMNIALQSMLFIGSSVLVGYLVTIMIEVPFVKLRDRLMPSTYKLVLKEGTGTTGTKLRAENSSARCEC
jgi:peptidoglycan/LPS O-acetylase OafA/YrhL